MPWILLVLTLSTENATARMRAWRALKASGAAVLRDGVYLLPALDSCRSTLTGIAEDVRASNGMAYLLDANGEEASFQGLFDRSPDFGELLADIAKTDASLTEITALATLKQARKLRRTFGQLAAIDFFPGEAQKQTDAALQELEQAVNRWLSPNEPHAAAGQIPCLAAEDYRGREWATRARPWVDRLASAWLIRRFIDPDARIRWLASPEECPADVLGFDFDGAAFTHVGAKVTFETLMAAFGLAPAPLTRLAGIVHFLDAGGIQPPESQGIERVLAGLRDTIPDDDQLLATASIVFDGLIAAFEQDAAA